MPAASQLKLAAPANDFAAALGKIVTEQQISYSQLADLSGGKAAGASRDFFYRLLNGQPHNTKTLWQLRPRLAAGLLGHLVSNGLDRKQAVAQLKRCFHQEELEPMIIERTTLPPAACKHFQLTRDPFTEKPTRREDVWLSDEHKKIVDRMIDAITKQKFICVIGDVGSGKSTLKKVFIDRLSSGEGDLKRKCLWPKAVGVNRVKAAHIERFILEAFEQRSSQDAIARTSRLENLLESLYLDNQRVGIAIDECHRLTDDTLQALKDFYELGTGGFISYLGIILIGQSEFNARLRDARHSPLAQRIEMVTMPSIEKYAHEYVAHRLKLAGGNSESLFEKKAIDVLAAHVTTPLALGNLCNKALRTAHRYSEEKVTESLLKSRLNLAKEPRIRAIKEAS